MRSSIARGLTLLAATTALAACGDNVRVPASDAAMDAAVDAEPDAAPVDGPPDATEPDAAPDASAADAAVDAAVDAVVDAAVDATVDAPVDAPVDAAGPIRLRVVASNLTSGNFQRYEEPGRRILDGLDPDIVLLQEFNVGTSTDAELRAFVDITFGPGFGYARETGATIPNGVVSRYPIVASGVWEDAQSPNREFVWARLDIPGPRDLWAVSVHLLTTSATIRRAEAAALAAYIAASVPAQDLLVVGGDLNTDNRGEAALAMLAAVVDTTGPHPVDQAGNDNTNAARAKPYDWVLADADLRALQTSTVLGPSTHPDGLVLDTRVYMPLTAVAPALVGDSGAPSMQHMAVVKDFIVP